MESSVDSEWFPSFRSDPITKLRACDAAIRKILSCEFSFDSINLLRQHLTATSTMLRYRSDFPSEYEPLSKSTLWFARLEQTLEDAVERTAVEKTSLPLRRCIEQRMFALLSEVMHMPVDRTEDSSDVLCVYGQGYFRVASLNFYLQSQTLRSGGFWGLARIPQWLHTAFVHPCVHAVTASSTKELELANILYVDAHELVSTHCVPVPVPEVLVGALALWSPDEGNLYNDIAKAVAAASLV